MTAKATIYLPSEVLGEIDAARDLLRRTGRPNVSRAQLLHWAWQVARGEICARPAPPPVTNSAVDADHVLALLEALRGRPVAAAHIAAGLDTHPDVAEAALRELYDDGCADRYARGRTVAWTAAGARPSTRPVPRGRAVTPNWAYPIARVMGLDVGARSTTGAQVYALRLSLDLSQAQMARLLFVTGSRLSQWEVTPDAPIGRDLTKWRHLLPG